MVQKSGEHQLRLVVYPITRFQHHPRWFSRRISEPSTLSENGWDWKTIRLPSFWVHRLFSGSFASLPSHFWVHRLFLGSTSIAFRVHSFREGNFPKKLPNRGFLGGKRCFCSNQHGRFRYPFVKFQGGVVCKCI